MIGRLPPPRNWRPRSPRSSQQMEDGLKATGHFELIAPARIAFSRSHIARASLTQRSRRKSLCLALRWAIEEGYQLVVMAALSDSGAI
jgi:hypothetical protein